MSGYARGVPPFRRRAEPTHGSNAASHLEVHITGPRPGRLRDRRGRGQRGPLSLPGPLTPRRVPLQRSPRDGFDALVVEIVQALGPRFASETPVEVVAEEAPLLPPEWDEPVPASVVVHSADPPRLVLYRLPLSQAATSQSDVADLVWTAVLEGLAELWHLPPEAIDPRR